MLYLNERRCVLIALLIAELGTSLAIYLLFPGSPIANAYSTTLSYVGGHLVPTVVGWAIFTLCTWFIANVSLWRAHRTLKGKKTTVLIACLAGTLISVGATIYLGLTSDRAMHAVDMVVAIAVRLVFYLILYWTSLGLMILAARNNVGFFYKWTE